MIEWMNPLALVLVLALLVNCGVVGE